jgi:hypothetical protein
MNFNNFLEEIKSEKYVGIFIFILLILVYHIYRNMCSCKKNIENIANLDDKEITNAINRYYSSDDFVKTMTTIFEKIQKNGLQIVGDIVVTGDVKADEEISNQNYSFTEINKKIDDKNNEIIQRKREAEEIQRKAYEEYARLEAERQAAIALSIEKRRREQEAAEAEKRRIAALGTCGHTPKRQWCPTTGARVACPNGGVYNNSCHAEQNGCLNCPYWSR